LGFERQRYRLSLSHIAEGEWRAQFMIHPINSASGDGVAPTPWKAVQFAAWMAPKRPGED
jgi:hypothetical protein